jgi:putative phage-type endonuclease
MNSLKTQGDSMQKIDLQQGTCEWLEFRRQHIGSSDAAIIMNASPFCTPYQCWARKLKLIPEQKETDAMRRGKELEPIALAEFEKEHDIFMFPSVYVSDEYPWMMASVDGISCDGQTVVEIKCPGKTTHSIALEGNVPEMYNWQLQHIMIVLKLKSMYYFSFDGFRNKSILVNRDDALCEKLIEAEKKFWSSMLNFEQPVLNERDYLQKTDENWLTMANRWKQIRNRIKELEQEEESVRSALIYLADQQNATGGGIRVQTVSRKGLVDYTKVPELQGVDLEKYRREGTQTIRIMEVA